MNHSPKHFQLIDGVFSSDQARQVLGAIVKSKIDYHILENHSAGERSGILNHSKQRLQSLHAIDTELKALFESARASGAKLKVTGNIEITLIE